MGCSGEGMKDGDVARARKGVSEAVRWSGEGDFSIRNG